MTWSTPNTVPPGDPVRVVEEARLLAELLETNINALLESNKTIILAGKGLTLATGEDISGKAIAGQECILALAYYYNKHGDAEIPVKIEMGGSIDSLEPHLREGAYIKEK